MRWWKRWCHSDADPTESRRAVEQAQAERKRVEDRDAYIERLAENLAKQNKDNHFSEIVFNAMRRKHP